MITDADETWHVLVHSLYVDVREGLSVIRDSVWSCFEQKVQLPFFTMF